MGAAPRMIGVIIIQRRFWMVTSIMTLQNSACTRKLLPEQRSYKFPRTLPGQKRNPRNRPALVLNRSRLRNLGVGTVPKQELQTLCNAGRGRRARSLVRVAKMLGPRLTQIVSAQPNR